MRCRLTAVVVALTIGSAPHAQPNYADPWDPVVDAAAERAVARLGAKLALEIRTEIRAIPQLIPGPAPR